ncbi:hypothetical protein Tco_1273317 [Tanacetum coccineum]
MTDFIWAYEFDQFVAEPGVALVSVYNRFAQLMNDLERNDMYFPIVTINTKFLNSLQPKWLKYVTQVRLAKRLTVDTFDDLFYYRQQFKNLVNVSRAKKFRISLQVLCSLNSGNAGRNNRRAYVQEETVEGSNARNETENVQRTLRTSSSGNTSTVQCYNCSGKGHYAISAHTTDASRMEEIEELSANICLMAWIQPVDNTSDAGPSYDSAFVSEVQSSSIKDNQEQMYLTHTKFINSTIGDDQIDSYIIFDKPNGNVNSGSVEKDTHVPDLYALE